MSEFTTPLSDNVSKLVTLEEAAATLGVSVRTIRRRIKSGELSGEMVNGRRLVSLLDFPRQDSHSATSPVTVSPNVRDNPDRDVHFLTDLQGRVTELEADRDRWRTQSDTWQGMAQDLSHRVQELTATLYRLTEQRALTPSAVDPKPESAPWWAFWRHVTTSST